MEPGSAFCSELGEWCGVCVWETHFFFPFPSRGWRIPLTGAFSFNYPRSLAPDPGQPSTRLYWVSLAVRQGFLKFLSRTSLDNSPHLATWSLFSPLSAGVVLLSLLFSPLPTAILPCRPRFNRVLGKASTRPGPGFCVPPGGGRAGQIREFAARRQEGAQCVQPESLAKTGLETLPSLDCASLRSHNW